MRIVAALCSLAALAPFALAQLSGSVGPTTSHAAKRNVICNVNSYGGSAGSSDIGPAILSAFTNCVLKNSGSTLYVPPGNYNMATWVTLTGGTHWAFQMDGFITRTATTGGHMIIITNANDFEMYSSTSAGTIQGNGYQCRNAGPRLLRFVGCTNCSLHDLIFVDSPEFHVVLDTVSNIEVYNLAIRGADIGGSDGIDIWGTNAWIHDVMVTNRDECVTVKSPASNVLVERIFCNQSGGSAIGSLSTGTAIQNVIYRNIYTNGGNQMFMIKSNGGDGYVRNVLFDSFLGVNTAYALDINQYWESTPGAGNGVVLSNLTWSNWDGYISDVARATVQIICSDTAPCSTINVKNVNLWSSSGTPHYLCESAYGTGACLKSGSGASYAATTVTYAKPSAYTTPPSMPGNLAAGFATNSPIPAPTIATSYYPGLPMISPLAKNTGSSNPTTTATATTTKPTTTTSSAPSSGSTQSVYGQCGGIGYTGPTVCASGSTCTYSNDYYSQCLPN